MHPYSLPRARIIRGRDLFNKLYNYGHRVSILHAMMVFIYDDSHFYMNPLFNYRVAFSVPKSLGNAVKRNRLRRIAKEQFRYRQNQLMDNLVFRCVSVSMIIHFYTLVNNYQEVSLMLATLIDKMSIFIWNRL